MLKRFLLIVIYLCFFSAYTKAAEIRVYFSPSPLCEQNLISFIDKAKVSIDAAVYAINDEKIVQALKKAQDRGVKIRILTDRLQASNKNSKVRELYNYGINIRVHSKHKIEHNKFAVFDSQSTLSGSYNWTNPAGDKNSENCIFFVEDSQISETFAKRFNYLWQVNSQEKSDKWFAKQKKKLFAHTL